MRRALAVLSLVAVITAEAPYHISRPAGPAFHLPSAPAPPPPPPVPRPPQPFLPQPQPFLPQPQHNFGYQYQQPNIGPTFVQPATQPQFPVYSHPPPFPQPLPQVNYPQPQPIQLPQPSQSYGLPQPRVPPPPPPPPAPTHHQPAFAPQPAPQFHQAQPQLHQPQPQLHQPQLQFHQPQLQFHQPQPQFHQPQPQFHQPQPQFNQPQPQFHQAIQLPQQQFTEQGYNYQQPQFGSNIPLQAQPLSNHIGLAALSSYQADSNQYSRAHEQIHKDALDSVVVDRVQNIIKENEHSSARDAGYLSLVSGVSLENAKPSVEISSFTQTSSLGSSQNLGLSHGSALLGPSSSYSLPITSNSHNSNLQASFDFLPQTKPATAYGPPN